jgi:hypothetical protein
MEARPDPEQAAGHPAKEEWQPALERQIAADRQRLEGYAQQDEKSKTGEGKGAAQKRHWRLTA